MEGLGLNLSYFVVQIFNFVLVLVILVAWVYKPIVNMMKTRREKITQGLEDARIASETRANAEKAAEEILAKAQQEVGKIVREATERGEQLRMEMKEAAETEIAKLREDAAADAQQEKEKVLGDLRGQVAALSIAAAQKVIGESLDEKRQRALIDDFFSGVKTGKVVLLEGKSITGTRAEVTSALPLTKKEQETVSKDVIGKLGESATISFRVDPNILGGLVIHIGDKILDGSVAGKLESLNRSLQ
ncbi:MAG: F0F1 ATP synthase subunit B [Anaerolineales bacterium]|nr:MAG: F0F1 ATP synthase subunit B [Anaerolineales bacterium]